MDSFISTFHIDWKIIIAQGINFVIVLLVLYAFALKPLKKLMNERTEKIEKGVNDAKTNALLLSNTQKEYDAIIARAKIEATELFMDARKEADKKKAEMLDNAKEEVAKLIENGKKTLEGEKAKMVEEAKGKIVSLVVSATEKLLETRPDQTYDDKSINQIKKI